MNSLQSFLKEAWDCGKRIDLSGVGYGRIHWGNRQDVKQEASTYYHFLAGLAYVSKATAAIEIGTHWGGSAVALKRGMNQNSARSRLVTIDITSESDNYLPNSGETGIVKIVGDANADSARREVARHLARADILYIDASHRALATLASFAIYGLHFRPRFVVFDDIALNPEMRQFWSVVQEGFHGSAVNVSDFLPEVRAVECGFGVVEMPLDVSPGAAFLERER